jgi:hypothetical protein
MKRFLKILLRTLLVLFLALNTMAAFHAWKFTHFYDDNTLRNSKPENWSGWQKTKAILFGIRYPKSQNNQQPDTTFTNISLKTDDGETIAGWYIKKAGTKGTVLMFHGHASSKSRVLPEAMSFTQMGYNVLLTDFRAHGNSSGNTCSIGYKEALDVKAAYEWVMQSGEKNIVLWGISLGAATISRAVAAYNLSPSKIILEMPFGSLLEAVKGRVRIMGLPEQPLAGLLTFWGGLELGFWAFNHKPYVYAKKINCPVLLQWGNKDSRVTKQEVDAIFTNLSTIQKKLVVYENTGHESLLLKDPQKWKQSIADFLQ